MEILAMVMAGGRGERLYPLTRDRAKPAVPFAGKYRIIDFVLSNLVNSGIYSIYVLTQFKSQSLVEHLQEGWLVSNPFRDYFVTPVAPQMRVGTDWYQGTADAVHQNLYLIQRSRPRSVAIFGADHIYKMNIRQMADFHWRNEADVTVSALPVPIEEASNFGVIEVDRDFRVLSFEEKPSRPRPILGEPDRVLASMGNYLFETKALVDALEDDAARAESDHDFGRDIFPRMVKRGARVQAYDFRTNRIPDIQKDEEPSYWRDVGTVKAYYEANIDMGSVAPSLNLYNRNWPIRTVSYSDPPAKFVFDENGRRGLALNSIVAEGTIVSGSVVRNSILGRNVRVHSFCLIEDSVIMNRVEIGRGSRIRRTIIDKNVYIPPGSEIGYDTAKDRERFTVSEGEIVVVPRQEPRSISR